jgi:hypothetical protein
MVPSARVDTLGETDVSVQVLNEWETEKLASYVLGLHDEGGRVNGEVERPVLGAKDNDLVMMAAGGG